MSANLITLQDHKVSIHAADALLASSPGFANITDKQPRFGETARQLARLQPRQSFNHFWSQISLDPLAVKNKYFRHAADLAHGHLQELKQGLPLDKDTIIAVPSHYTRSQLSVLLGVVRTSDIPVNGLVDLSLLQAMASGSDADTCIIVDLQLHQAVLTSFHKVDGYLQRDRVVQVPASGLLALQDAWTNLIADEFIRQTRFDPKHNAEIEQHLYNQLDLWIAQSAAADELLIDINHKGTVHQARMTHQGFVQRSRNVFERIQKELDLLRSKDSSVHILRSHLDLPGLTAGLSGIRGLDDDLLLDCCLGSLPHIQSAVDQIQFVTRLPLSALEGSSSNTVAQQLPSHVLINDRAYALPLGKLVIGSPIADDGYARAVALPELGEGAAIILDRKRKQLLLQLHELTTLHVNGQSVSSGIELQLGDCLQAGENGSILRLIQVE